MIRSIAFVLCLSASAAWANQESPRLTVAEGDFAAQRAEIEADLADGKTYREISASDRTKVRESLNRIEGMLEGVASVDSLNEEAKARLFNDQEQVNNILTSAAADSRLVCERSAPTGSNRKITTCQTVAERDRRRDRDQGNLRDMQRGIMPANR